MTSLHTESLLWLAVLLPFVGVLAGLVAGERRVRVVAALMIPAGIAIAGGIALGWLESRTTLTYLLGGWAPPLGIALRADGIAVAMLAAIAGVVGGIALYARADFATPGRATFTYWLLLLAVWGSLNLVFLAGDLFTLYVALELLTFSGVPLVCLDGRGETLRAALRYLLFALAGSLLYLLGAVLLYGAYGTLDIALLAGRIRPETIAWTAGALMTVGLLAKTALFPLHLWLPPAHAGAPAAASAVLSALVVKGSWFLTVRLWFDVLGHGIATPAAAQLLGGLGAAAIVIGSLVALRQQRLKLLVAYSTIAQIGYLFLMFPLAFDATGVVAAGGAALDAGTLQAIAHATAKAGMFMAAGLVYKALGHDRIGDLAGIGRALPVTVLAFAVAGIALMGILPSGAYLAKKLLLDAATGSGQWWWTIVLQGGAVFTAGYVVLVLTHALRRPAVATTVKPVSLLSQFAALGLATCSLLLALATLGPVPAHLVKSPLAPSELVPTALTLAGGAVLAFAFARAALVRSGDREGVARTVGVALGAACERFDERLRRWPVATLALLLLAAAFAALFAGAVSY